MSKPPIFFDFFGTLADMSAVPRDEIKAYLAQCVDTKWRPMTHPLSWLTIRAFPDVAEGLRRLSGKYLCATLSNGAPPVLQGILEANRLAIMQIDLGDIRRYKPHPDCYLYACECAGVDPSEAMMVTANPTFGPYPFGDIQIAGAIGMQTRLIRNPGGPADIIALAEELGC